MSIGLAGLLLATLHHEEIRSTVSIWDAEWGFAFDDPTWAIGSEEDTELLKHLASSGWGRWTYYLDVDPNMISLAKPGDSILICYRELRMPLSDWTAGQTRVRLGGADGWIACHSYADPIQLGAFAGLLAAPLLVCFMLAVLVGREPTKPKVESLTS